MPEPRKMPLKVYAWVGYYRKMPEGTPRGRRQSREIVAATSMKKAAAFYGRDSARSLDMNETGNAREIEIAMAEPGVIFWRPLDHREGEWFRSNLRKGTT